MAKCENPENPFHPENPDSDNVKKTFVDLYNLYMVKELWQS